MSLVNVTNVVVLDNPAQFTSPFQFEITFECMQDLEEDLEWSVIYVGSSESSDYDQPLEEVLVGPVTAGRHKFVLQAGAPNPRDIPHTPLGITVVLIACSYRNHEFVRIGYYVNNEMQSEQQERNDDDEELENTEEQSTTAPYPSCGSLDLTKIVRTTLADKPRVTRFAIPWEEEQVQSNTNEQAMEQSNTDEQVMMQSNEQSDDIMVAPSSPEISSSMEDYRVVSPTHYENSVMVM